MPLHCPYCSIRWRWRVRGRADDGRVEAVFSEARDLAAEAWASGGEPLLRKDLESAGRSRARVGCTRRW